MPRILVILAISYWLLVIGFLFNHHSFVYAISPTPIPPQVQAQNFLDSILGWMNQKSFDPFLQANLPPTPIPTTVSPVPSVSTNVKGLSGTNNDIHTIDNYYLANGFRTPNAAVTNKDWIQLIKEDILGIGYQQGDDFLRTFIPSNIADQYKDSPHDRYFRTAQCVGLPYCDSDNLPTWTDTPQNVLPTPTVSPSAGGH